MKQVVETEKLLRQLNARRKIAIDKIKKTDADIAECLELDVRIQQLNEIIKLVNDLSQEEK